MQNSKSVIAKILLFGYLLTVVAPAFPAEGSWKVNKACKRSYAEIQQRQTAPLQLNFQATENAMKNIPQTAVTLFCGSASIHLSSPLTGELPLEPQQASSFAAFIPSHYSILFFELDPDPPKATRC